MKKKVLLVMAMTLGLLIPLSAQTDVTDQYITNPSFEAPEDPSTNGVSPTLTGWERNYIDGYNWNGCNGDWFTEGARSYGIWSPVIDNDFELSQELTLPDGTYTLTVDMTVSKSNGVSRMNGQRMFAGDMEVYYPASAETERDNGAAYQLSITTKVTGGKLKIGIRTDGGTSVGIGWFKVDNFRLYSYEGDDGYLLYCQSLLSNLENDAISLSSELPLGNAAQLLAIKDKLLQDVEGSEDPKDYEEAIAELTQAIADMQPARDVYFKLLKLINEDCVELKKLNYPGLDAFNSAIDATLPILGNADAIQEDFENAIEGLNAAIRAYRFSEFPNATADNPVDVTWAISSPQFTKPDGDPSNSADLDDTGWLRNNVYSSSDFVLKTINGKNCWNNWSDNFTSMDVYQLLEGMPAGLYTFECYQTNNGPEVTDQHAYATALGVTAVSLPAEYTFAEDPDPDKGNFDQNSKWEGPLVTEKVLVGADGNLRIGFASTSNGNGSSGWFCFTDCVLKYYGTGSYDEAMAKLIVEAEDLTEAEMLRSDLAALEVAIETARTVDTSDPETAEAGMAALNEAMATTRTAIDALASFKTGTYAKVWVVARNEEGIYAQDLQSLMERVILDTDEVLDSEETTSAIYPELTEELDIYLSFANAYHAFDIYGVNLMNNVDEELAELVLAVLAENCALVVESKNAIEPAKQAFKNTMSFCDSYGIVLNYVLENGNDKLALLLGQQLAVVQADHSAVLTAQKALLEEYVKIAYDGVELLPETDMTWVIANPGFESEADESSTGVGTVEGWNRTTTDGYAWSGCNGDWKTEGERSFGIWNEVIGSDFEFWQTLIVPNGVYRVTVDMTVSKSGAISRVNGQRLFAGYKEVYYPADAETATDNGEPYNLVAEVEIEDYKLDIGVRTDGGTQSGIGWFKVDDFKLFWLSEPTAIENIYTDADGELVVYVENGYIVAPGADTFSITTLNGVLVPADTQLIQGIYLVKANGRVAKVMVP